MGGGGTKALLSPPPLRSASAVMDNWFKPNCRPIDVLKSSTFQFWQGTKQNWNTNQKLFSCSSFIDEDIMSISHFPKINWYCELVHTMIIEDPTYFNFVRRINILQTHLKKLKGFKYWILTLLVFKNRINETYLIEIMVHIWIQVHMMW